VVGNRPSGNGGLSLDMRATIVDRSGPTLFTPTQPGGSLFGLQESNQVTTEAANNGNVDDYGTDSDFMLGKRPIGP
jgi:hypothetical protein